MKCFYFLLLIPTASTMSTVREQRAWDRKGRWAEQLEEVPEPRVGEAGDKRAAEVGNKNSV